MNTKQHQQGLSMIELLISITLGIILMAAVLQLFVGNKQSYRTQDAQTRMQENARFAKHVLDRDIRMAGFQGCSNSTDYLPTILVNPATTAPFSNDEVVMGYESVGNTWTPSLPTSLAGRVAPGTDVVVVRKASGERAHLTADMASPAAALQVDNRINIVNNDILFVTDCENADIFRVTGASGSPFLVSHSNSGNSSNSLSKAYSSDAQVNRYESFAYYIGDTGRVNDQGNAIFALFRQDINGNNDEIADGIENMKITYGVDSTSDGAADRYLGASNVNSAALWPQVVSVNVAMLLNSIEGISPQAQAYTFNGTTVSSPGDLMLRRQMNSYIALRNRVL